MKGEIVTVKFETKDGSAINGKHYEACSGILTFEPMQMSATVEVKLIDDVQWAPDSNFFVHLSEAVVQGQAAPILGDKMEV